MCASLAEVRETLTLAGGASNLVQPVIDRMLFENVRKFTPLRRVLPRQTWMTPTYLFNKRTGYPKSQATTEAPPTTGTGSVAASNSTYSQVGFDIKHYESNLDLSNFAIQVARVNGNLQDLELDGASKSMVWFEEMVHLYGSAGATVNTKRPQHDGFDMLMSTSTKLDMGGNLLDIRHLDKLIDTIKVAEASDELGKKYFFLVSPAMMSQANSLFVQNARYVKDMMVFTRDDYGIPNAAVVDNAFDAGIEVISYRGVPFFESSFVGNIGTMGTIAASDTGAVSGGQLANSAYSYVVEVVTDYGISVASNEVTVTPTSAHGITVTWSTPSITDADGNTRQNLLFRIHRTLAGGASGTETLYAVVPALDANDSAVTSFLDSGIPSTSASVYTTVLTSGSASVPDGVTFPRIQSNGTVLEDIWMLPRDPDICVVAAVNEMQTRLLAPVNARSTQLALIADETLAVRGPRFMAKLCRARAS